jgi:hypothetical protein
VSPTSGRPIGCGGDPQAPRRIGLHPICRLARLCEAVDWYVAARSFWGFQVYISALDAISGRCLLPLKFFLRLSCCCQISAITRIVSAHPWRLSAVSGSELVQNSSRTSPIIRAAHSLGGARENRSEYVIEHMRCHPLAAARVINPLIERRYGVFQFKAMLANEIGKVRRLGSQSCRHRLNRMECVLIVLHLLRRAG